MALEFPPLFAASRYIVGGLQATLAANELVGDRRGSLLGVGLVRSLSRGCEAQELRVLKGSFKRSAGKDYSSCHSGNIERRCLLVVSIGEREIGEL